MTGRTHSIETRQKMSESRRGKRFTEEHRRNISKGMTGKTHSKEHKKKQSESMKEHWKNHEYSMKGKEHSLETRQRMSESRTGRKKSKEHKRKISESMTGSKKSKEHMRKVSEANRGKKRSAKFKREKSKIMKRLWANPETRAKMCLPPIYVGEDSPHWKGGISFEPYCPKFNSRLKERIRNRDNRTCVLCGKAEIRNGRRLSVHHIDNDKLQGCDGKKWYLCALCRSCNNKKDTLMKEFLIVANMASPSVLGPSV